MRGKDLSSYPKGFFFEPGVLSDEADAEAGSVKIRSAFRRVSTSWSDVSNVATTSSFGGRWSVNTTIHSSSSRPKGN